MGLFQHLLIGAWCTWTKICDYFFRAPLWTPKYFHTPLPWNMYVNTTENSFWSQVLLTKIGRPLLSWSDTSPLLCPSKLIKPPCENVDRVKFSFKPDHLFPLLKILCQSFYACCHICVVYIYFILLKRR